MKRKSEKRAKEYLKASNRFEHSENRSRSADRVAVELTGKVHEFRTNHQDEVDGFLLVDGTVVRFSAYIAPEIEGRIERGDDVRIVGTHHETSQGHIQLRETLISCPKSGFEIEINRADEKKHNPVPVNRRVNLRNCSDEPDHSTAF